MTDTIEPDTEPMDPDELEEHWQDLKRRIARAVTACEVCGERGTWGGKYCGSCREAKKGRWVK